MSLYVKYLINTFIFILVKDTDGIWYKAKVTDVKNEGQSYDVLFDSSERTATVDIADIIPCQSGADRWR